MMAAMATVAVMLYITIRYRYCGLTFVIRITYVPLNRIALKDTHTTSIQNNFIYYY